jgi:hypothetical protein
MARNNTQYRFYRSNLETIVWDKEKNCALAEFVNGQFVTDDPEVAQVLLDLGYPRIPLDATSPPDIMYPKGSILEDNKDVNVLPAALGETAALNREKAQAALNRMKESEKDQDEETPIPRKLKKKKVGDKQTKTVKKKKIKSSTK